MNDKITLKRFLTVLKAYQVKYEQKDGKMILDFSDIVAFDIDMPISKKIEIVHNNDPYLFHKNLNKYFIDYDTEDIVDKMVKTYEKENGEKPLYRDIAVWVRFVTEQKGILGCITSDIKEVIEQEELKDIENEIM